MSEVFQYFKVSSLGTCLRQTSLYSLRFPWKKKIRISKLLVGGGQLLETETDFSLKVKEEE